MNDLQQLPSTTVSTASLVLDVNHMGNMMEFARVMSSGVATVPKHLQKNTGDCLAIVMQAVQWGMSPFVVAQKTHLVNGVLGYEAQLVAAVVNSSGALNGRLKVNFIGPWDEFKKRNFPKEMESQVGVSVYATMKGDTEAAVLPAFYLSSITIRNSPLWKNAPDQQMTYLAQKRWTRMFCPEALLGVYTTDELQEKDITPQFEQPEPRMSPAERLKAAASYEAVGAINVQPTEPQGPSLDELIAQLNRSKSNDDVKAVNALAMDLNDADRAEYGEALDMFKEVRKQAAARKAEEDAALAEKKVETTDEFLAGLDSEDELPM